MNLRQQLKFNARGFLAAGKPSSLLVGLAAIGIMLVLQIMDSEITNATEHSAALMDAMNSFMRNPNHELLMNAIMSSQPTFVQFLLSTLLSLMGIMVSTGVVVFVMSRVRYGAGSYGSLFDGLPILVRVVWYQLVTAVYTWLWSMLLIVPGIIANYSYRQGLYILIDHPEMGVNECIRASKHMMGGKKMELFVIDLSFIGWTFLESAVATVINYGVGGYAGPLLMLPITTFIRMYMEFTMFLYYEHLHGVHYEPRVRSANPTES